MEPEFRSFLDSELAQVGAARALVLSPWDLAPLPGHATQLRSPAELDGLPDGGRDFFLAMTAGVLEFLSLEQGGELLATLRDLRAQRLLAVVPAVGSSEHESAWDLSQMLSHGLEAITTLGSGDRALAVYAFHIDDYKRTPDWLNARNWANPENWNRFRW